MSNSKEVPNAKKSIGEQSCDPSVDWRTWAYTSLPSIDLRYPKSNGMQRLKLVQRDYRVSHLLQTKHYDPTTNMQMCIDHPRNTRGEVSTIIEYEGSLRKHSFIPAIRGAFWAVYSKGAKPPFKMIAGAQLTKAMYRVIVKYSDVSDVRLVYP